MNKATIAGALFVVLASPGFNQLPSGNPAVAPMPGYQAAPAPAMVSLSRRKDFATFMTRYQVNNGMVITPPVAQSVAVQMAMKNRQLPLSFEEKVARTERQALQTFTRFRDDMPGLLKHLEQDYGVIIVDGKSHPWVDKHLKAQGADAQFLSPGSPLYGMKGIETSQFTPGSYLADYTDFIRHMEKYGRTAILLKSKRRKKREDLLHETFHFFQYINGLPLQTDKMETQIGVSSFVQQIYPLLANPFMATGVGFEKLKLNIRKRFKPIPEKPGGVGASVRQLMDLEVGDTKFLRKNRKNLKLSLWEAYYERLRQYTYDSVRDLSWLVDREDLKRASPGSAG